MPVISLEPQTNTDPSQIPATGGTVTFTVRALCPTGAQMARFTFELQPGDGYQWSNGGTSIDEIANIDNTLRDYPFGLTLQQIAVTGAKLILVNVQGVLVAGSSPKDSLARLTVGGELPELLRGHREENNLDRSDLAANLGISTSWLGKIENGASPSARLLETIKRTVEAR